MSSVIQNLLDGVVGDGARSTKFECFINFADSRLIGSERDIIALVKTSQFPGKSHDTIDIKFKGRTIPVKGQTKYDNTWTCTFYLTQDHELKKSLEDWIESLDQENNIKEVSKEVLAAQQKNKTDGYASTLKIAQMDFAGTDNTFIYELHHAFPKSVSAVDVDYSSVGTITEFTVEFSYAYYDSYKAEDRFTTIASVLRKEAKEAISSITNSVTSEISKAFSNSSVGKSMSSGHSEFNSSAKKTISSASKMITKVDW